MASFVGCYAIPTAQYDLTIVATNKLPESAYRGMGPPPHNFVLEQLMDIAASSLGIDPAEIRRKNFIPARPSGYFDDVQVKALVQTLIEREVMVTETLRSLAAQEA